MVRNFREIEFVLSELVKVLNEEGETNWSRGINAALSHVKTGTEDDYLMARSIYKTMCMGGAGFMEYYIKRDSFEEQRIANTKLESMRDRLWDMFDC